MLGQKVVQILKQYQKAPASTKRAYLDHFEEKMIYRTTKTENPEVTLKMVRDVLYKSK